MDEKLEFPLTAHHRVIVTAEAKDLEGMRRLFDGFELVEPIAEARASSGGKYAWISVSVRFRDQDEMSRFDEQLKKGPGLKMVL